MDITITISGGRFATPEELHGPISEAVGLTAKEAQKIFHDNSPIGEDDGGYHPGHPGMLHDSWVVQPGTWESFVFLQNVANVAQNKGYYYARRVDKVSKKNAGYIGRMISIANAQAIAKMRETGGELAARLWVKE